MGGAYYLYIQLHFRMAEFMPLDGERIGHRLRAELGRVLR